MCDIENDRREKSYNGKYVKSVNSIGGYGYFFNGNRKIIKLCEICEMCGNFQKRVAGGK